MKLKKLIYLIFPTIITSSGVKAQIIINEIMSNNISTMLDEDVDYSDWIELYNAGSSSVNLNNYKLSDDIDSLSKWRIPSINLPAGQYRIIWCSGKDKTGSELHTNFSLKASGESIFLSNSSGTVIDNVTFPFLPADKSYGRLPNGGTSLDYLSLASPGASNNNAQSIAGAVTLLPVFSIPGGLYTTSQDVILSCQDPSGVVRYTTDGSDPTEVSPAYSAPVNVHSRAGEANFYSMIRTGYANHSYLPDWQPPVGEVYKCCVIRARVFKTGYYPGPVITQTYFVDPNIFTRYGSLPFVSVVSDPKNLFNDTTGIYVPGLTYQATQDHGNYHNGWHRPANIEMYLPNGSCAFNGNFEISIGGESSQSSPQKALNVNASSDFGPEEVYYPVFENTPGRAKYIQHFDKIKLRSWGTDRRKGLLHDAFCNSFMYNTDIDYAAYQPCVLFIDGEYWGLQEIRERNRESSYFEEHYLIDQDNPGFDILKGGDDDVEEGDAVHWDAMMDYINSHPMTSSSSYNYVKTQMDVDNFMLDYMFSIYLARGDWPDQNEAKWRPKIPGGKWKWIQWDMDNTVANNLTPWFDMFDQVLVGNANYGPSPLLVKLIDNTEFKNKFINLFADYMNTVFLPTIAQAHLDEKVNELMPYIQEFKDRWQLNYTWQDRLDSMEWWLNKRPKYVKEHIMDDFSAGDTLALTLNVSDTAKGKIKVNTILLDGNTPRLTTQTYPWTGKYFENIPVPLTAIPNPGYRFVKWLPSNNTNSTILYNLSSNATVTAMFDVDTNYVPEVLPVINEVMSANASAVQDNYGDYDDWVEIYNPGNDTLNLAGYYMTDHLVLPTRFSFLPGNDSTKIPPHGHLLVWMDDDTEQGILHAPFKLNSSGDFIALIAPDGETIIDSVSFGSLPINTSYGRRHDGADTYIVFTISTPASENWIYTTENILINELQPDNLNTYFDNYNEADPWIELYNPNPDTISVEGWRISDNLSGNPSFRFGYDNDSLKIPPYGFRVIWADGQNDQGVIHTDFQISSTGCISLYKPGQILSDSICYSAIYQDNSYGRISDGNPVWMNFTVPTPDSNNTDLASGDIYINELQTENTSTFSDLYGEFDPWLELYNASADTVNLAGWSLVETTGQQQVLQFSYGNDSTKIAPGGFRLVWLDGEAYQGVFHSFDTIPADGCLKIIRANMTISDSMCYAGIYPDESWGRVADGAPDWMYFTIPTPDSNNTDLASGDLFINELQAENISTYSDEYGEYDPWLELYNPGSDTVNIAGWYLSPDATLSQTFRIAHGSDSTKIPPHGFKVIWPDGQEGQGILHTDFVLPVDGCISLLKQTMELDDSVCYAAAGVGNSFGRISDGDPAWMVFVIPTPDSNNVDLSTGMPRLSGTGRLMLYPNPVSTGIVMFNKTVSLWLYDATARILGRYVNIHSIDFTSMAKGIYFIRSDEGEKLKVIKN